jgi:hypothetical protein
VIRTPGLTGEQCPPARGPPEHDCPTGKRRQARADEVADEAFVAAVVHGSFDSRDRNYHRVKQGEPAGEPAPANLKASPANSMFAAVTAGRRRPV